MALVDLVPRDALLVAVPLYAKSVCLDMKRKADICALKHTKNKKSYIILHVQKDNVNFNFLLFSYIIIYKYIFEDKFYKT